VRLNELLDGDKSSKDPWVLKAVAPGAIGVVQCVGQLGPPQYFVRFECGLLTVRGWYYASQLRPHVHA
jgi:hypothetical protein